MIHTEERTYLRELWAKENPEVPYSFYEMNYGLNMQEVFGEFHITENGEVVMKFLSGKKHFANKYDDRRKPNEIQTTD